eukprot:TRINITY_DN36942_c0_g1_i1.p1 TRINITY_DN36942_c0_g1~~TRINITY_DN36942_c0_g1_i1.p1  ORF type:complete len:107 (+),score=26.62 TRINITY_DN36942_c0_g1_i1:41-361(+)
MGACRSCDTAEEASAQVVQESFPAPFGEAFPPKFLGDVTSGHQARHDEADELSQQQIACLAELPRFHWDPTNPEQSTEALIALAVGIEKRLEQQAALSGCATEATW